MKAQYLFCIMHANERIELYNFITHNILYRGMLKDLPYKFYESYVYNISSDCIDDNSMIFITVRY